MCTICIKSFLNIRTKALLRQNAISLFNNNNNDDDANKEATIDNVVKLLKGAENSHKKVDTINAAAAKFLPTFVTVLYPNEDTAAFISNMEEEDKKSFSVATKKRFMEDEKRLTDTFVLEEKFMQPDNMNYLKVWLLILLVIFFITMMMK